MTDSNELRALPVAKRLKLIEDLWDSIATDADAVPLPDWHCAEIDRRLEALDSGASVGAPVGGGASACRRQIVTATLVVQPEAEADLDEAFHWYEARRPGLGHEFLEEVSRAFTRIAEQPLRYALVHREARRTLLRRFP